MTLIICEKHGTSGFFESCEHVQELLTKKRFDDVKVIRAYVYQMKICESCISKYHLGKYVIDNPEQYKETMSEPDEFWKDFEKAYDSMENRISWCVHCYNDLF